jgi:hypothetical protein
MVSSDEFKAVAYPAPPCVPHGIQPIPVEHAQGKSEGRINGYTKIG